MHSNMKISHMFKSNQSKIKYIQPFKTEHNTYI